MSLYSPKPVLKVYQDHKRPEYLYEQNRLPMITSGILKPTESTEEKSIKSLTQFLEHKDVEKKQQV